MTTILRGGFDPEQEARLKEIARRHNPRPDEVPHETKFESARDENGGVTIKGFTFTFTDGTQQTVPVHEPFSMKLVPNQSDCPKCGKKSAGVFHCSHCNAEMCPTCSRDKGIHPCPSQSGLSVEPESLQIDVTRIPSPPSQKPHSSSASTSGMSPDIVAVNGIRPRS